MNENLEYIIKHPIKTIGTATAILLMTNTVKGQDKLEGRITDPLTQEGLEGKKITLKLYDPSNGTYLGTTNPTLTDINGYFTFDNITDVEDEQETNTKAIIQYKANKIFTNNNNRKILTIYDAATKEQVKQIETTNKEIDIDLQGLAASRYITILQINDKAYANVAAATKDGKIIGYIRLEDYLTEENHTTLNKTAAIGATISITDETNTHQNYIEGGIGNWTGTKTLNITLPPIIQLQNQFTDTEVNYQINNIMDLWKYMGRVQNENDYGLYAKTLWPIKIFKGTNMPQEWEQYINNAINTVRDSIGITPDSILQITNEYTEPNYNLGYSAMNIIYMDSTEYKSLFGDNGFSGSAFIFDGASESFTGYRIYLNTDKITNPIDAQKFILKQIEMYITQSTYPINDPNYLGQTDNTQGPGTATTYNDDEKTLMKMVRNMSPNVWINRFFNPEETLGKIYTPAAPNGYEMKGHLLVPKEDIITQENAAMYHQMRKQLEEKQER